MAVTKEFLQGEILSLESEIQKAQAFLIRAQAVLDSYRMLVGKCDEPELELNDGSDLP